MRQKCGTAASVRRFGRYQGTVALATFLGAACGTGGAPPLAPPPAITLRPSVVVPPPDVSGTWNLTQTLTSISEVCGWAQAQGLVVGTSIGHHLWVGRSGTEVSLSYGTYDPFDAVPLVGDLDGEAFTASASYAGSRPCRGQRPDYTFESRVVGQFSPDRRALTARETSTYRFQSGAIAVFSFDWAATR